ncbi:SusC/RagA family TonB-linked outer membrane protein [Bacteroides sedimenti]|uniref:SusC/RagA family TonB-linked outer membrane protein n=1 Tax=Bacteroides sedimenti TaxID=2136147 RepID=A0ABN6Z7P1_9BACE
MNKQFLKVFSKRCLSAFAITLIFSTGESLSAIASVTNGKNASYSIKEQLQNITVKGQVTDTKGEAIIGASISEKGTSNGIISDVNGKFTLTVKAKATLVVTCIGFKPTSVAVGTSSTINIVLTEDTKTLDEVVVTAMGIKKEKKALGYSVQDIKSDEILKNKNTNVINSLNGKIAGVNVTQGGGGAGSGANIVIRGGTSLERDNQPLFVIDGMIYDNTTDIGGNSGFDGAMRTNSTYSNRVMDINPEDVESMSVLKGPAAAALYGSKAAAGVVVITTKKGQEGNVKVNLSSKFSTNWVNRYPEQQDQYKRGYYNTAGGLDEYTLQSWGEKFKTGEKMYNNIEDFFKSSGTWDNNINISGGNKNGNFYLSASRYDQDGIIPETGYIKNTFRFNGEQKYGKLTAGANVAYSVASADKSLTSGGLYNSGGTGAMVSVYRWPRSEDMSHWLNDDGSKYRMFEGLQQVDEDIDNPYWIVNRNKVNDKTTRFTGTLNLKLDVVDWFNIAYTGGTDYYTTNTRRLIEPGSGVELLYQKGLLSENDRTYEYLSSNLMLNFKKAFGDFDFNLLLGNTIEDTRTSSNGRLGWNFVAPNFFSITNTAQTDRSITQYNSRKRLIGAYGEFRAGYKNILYATITGRNDWTSTLPVDNQSYFYPSVGGSFVFTELIPKNNILSFGKVRASWARVGKDTDPYVTNTYLDDPIITILGANGFENAWTKGNPYLKPEITKSVELGLELRFFNGRFGFDYTYYSNRSYNQLLSPRTSQTTGYIFMKTNAGDINNKGMELSITGTPIKTKDFTWDMTLNMSGNRGKVDNLLQGLEVLYVTDVQVGNAKAASFNKGNFMAISGSKYARDKDGNMILNWDNGMPTSDGLTTYEIGNREPKFLGGFNNSLQYKNWNFSFLFDYRVGGDIYNGTDYFMTTTGMSKRSMNRESITTTGVAKNPTTGEFEKKTYTITDKNLIQQYWETYYSYESANFMTKTNWLRLRSVSLSYAFPSSMLKKTKLIKDLSATVTGTNLLLWTNYKGMDPETSAAGAGVTGSSSVGIDYCGVPATAGMSFGINITF